MIIPTLGCPSHCKYCWSSEETSPIMTIETITEIVSWLNTFSEERITFTFHGGEPLLAGPTFYREALAILSAGLPQTRTEFAIQTNLWLMTPELAEIFAEYHVPIGSSIDGPEELNDLQRGDGYFQKNMRGYEIARSHGLVVRYICTFTNHSYQKRDEIVQFFLKNGFVLKLHPALPSLRGKNPKEWALDPEEFGDLLIYLLDQSLLHYHEIEIMNINDLVRGVFTRRGNVCTFADCMGSTFAIGPDGSIYPCYRFVGMDQYIMGTAYGRPTREMLMQSPAGTLMTAYRDFVDIACRDCAHIRYCRGGCPYNAIAPTDGEIKGVDPHCIAYKKIFDEITDRLNTEMFESPPMEMPGFGMPSQPQKPGVMALMHKVVMQ